MDVGGLPVRWRKWRPGAGPPGLAERLMAPRATSYKSSNFFCEIQVLSWTPERAPPMSPMP